MGWRPHIFNAKLIQQLALKHAEALLRSIYKDQWFTMEAEAREQLLQSTAISYAEAMENYVFRYADLID
jgi:hypothetical protein